MIPFAANFLPQQPITTTANRTNKVNIFGAYGLSRARYIGLAKIHLQHLMTAAAINLKRIFNWLQEILHATTRISQFARLMAQTAG